jgi:hypothetical protein
MLSFAVYSTGQLVEKIELAGAYLVGNDDVPLRAELALKDGIIICKKRAPGPAGLAILWEVEGVGTILLETVRLLERKKPYVLQVELARYRLLRLSQKAEDWGLLGYEEDEAISDRVARSRALLIQALQADTPQDAAAKGGQALAEAVKASEALSRLHAEVLVKRRKQSGGFPPRVLGCSVPLDKPTELHGQRLAAAFDFVTLPIVWRDIEPGEQAYNWKPLDAWVELLAKQHMPMKGSALLSFNAKSVPDWLYIWEHDFDTIRDLAYEHVRRVINRYGQYIQVWDVITGIHAGNCFAFTFEQLMELTRMAASLVKQTSPRATAIIDIVAPWGEYYARDTRTVPPALYADAAVQSGINFDAFGLQFAFGPGVDGMFVRDMFQVSSMLDMFVKLGKPLHITAVQVPSETTTPGAHQEGGEPGAINGGVWREPWTEQVQSEWLREFLPIALSKPFVESVSWHGLTDHGGQSVPHGGLLRPNLEPKAAYEQLIETRALLLGSRPGLRDTRRQPTT